MNLIYLICYLYWIPKLHKSPYKQRYSKILTEVTEKLQKLCTTIYPRSGVNQMWILKNAESLKSQNLNEINNIKTYDITTLYTTSLQDKLKSRLFDITYTCFFVVKMRTLSLEI